MGSGNANIAMVIVIAAAVLIQLVLPVMEQNF